MGIAYADAMRAGAFLIFLATSGLSAQDISDAPEGATLPLIVEIPSPPVAVRANGEHRLSYDTHLTNWSSQEMILTSIEVLPKRDNSQGFLLAGEGLEHSLINGDARSPNKRRIAPGGRAVVLFFLSASGVPNEFYHRVRFHSAGKEEVMLTSPAKVTVEGLTIQPPLRGKQWKALNGPGSNSHHRRGMFPYKGRLVVPQRWAIDFLQVNEKGQTYSGDENKNTNYFCYGAEALAVKSATVSEIRDGIPENVPHSNETAVVMGWGTVSGNQVVLDIGGGRFAIYAHLQPGSLRVKVGDCVEAGQVLGLVGNSGSSTEPHLHFQISDALNLGGEGVPYMIDRFVRNGVEHKGEIPLDEWLVEFP